MPRRKLLALLLAAGALAACHREQTANCEATARYARASSIPPVQIPDDLSPPDESDSLRLPDDRAPTRAPTQPCLESPPAFSAGAAGRDAAAPGVQPGSPADAPPPVPPAPPPSTDREISN